MFPFRFVDADWTIIKRFFSLQSVLVYCLQTFHGNQKSTGKMFLIENSSWISLCCLKWLPSNRSWSDGRFTASLSKKNNMDRIVNKWQIFIFRFFPSPSCLHKHLNVNLRRKNWSNSDILHRFCTIHNLWIHFWKFWFSYFSKTFLSAEN